MVAKAEDAEKDRWRTEAEAQQTQRRVSRCAYRIWRVRLIFLAILAAGRCFKESWISGPGLDFARR
jgi:hypothetical protein